MDASEIQTLRAAEVSLAIASQLIQVEPTVEWIRECRQDRLFEEAPFGGDNLDVSEGLALCDGWVMALDDNSLEAAVGQLQREWLRLFIGLGAPEAPVWESFYTESNNQLFGTSTLAVRALYKKYGLEFERKGKEPDDALGIMLSFLAHVLSCEITARECGNEDTANVTYEDGEAFLINHILPWLPSWRYLANNHAKTDYYKGVSQFVFGLLTAYAERYHIRYLPEETRFVQSPQ